MIQPIKVEYKNNGARSISPVFKDSIFRLLFLNTLLVILGYAVMRLGGASVFQLVKTFRLLLIAASLFFVLKKNGINVKQLVNTKVIFILLWLVGFLSLFSPDPFSSIYRASTFIIPFLYIVYSINYLLRYGVFSLLKAFSLLVLIIYAFVPLSFIVFGGDLSATNIYGEEEGQAFVSNHYGWGSTLYILSAFTILKYFKLKKIYKIAIIIFLPIAFYILIISANRSGMLSLGLAIFTLIIKDRQLSVFKKIIICIIPIIIVFYLGTTNNSAIQYLKQKNEIQLASGGDARFATAQIMTEELNENPILWITGVGMFNYSYLLKADSFLKGYHNSYFEILFGAGIVAFILFIYFVVLYPFKIFWKSIANYSLLFYPLAIIPFFESDLTAGQFLFFPWFTIIAILNAKQLKGVKTY